MEERKEEPMGLQMRIFSLMLVIGTVGGCRTVALSDEARATVRRVSIQVQEGKVTYTGKLPSAYEVDNGNGFLKHPLTMPLGVAIELVSYRKTQKRKAHRLKEIFDGAEVDVLAEVEESFVSGLRDAGIFAVVAKAQDADAQLTLTVGYGIQGASVLEESWQPWIEVQGVLRSQDARTIWKKSVELNPRDGKLKELPFPDPFEDAANLRRNYRRGAEILVGELLNHLAGV